MHNLPNSGFRNNPENLSSLNTVSGLYEEANVKQLQRFHILNISSQCSRYAFGSIGYIHNLNILNCVLEKIFFC